MKIYNIRILFYSLIFFSLFSCQQNNPAELKLEKEFLENGDAVYHLMKGDSNLIDIGVLKTGKLKFVSNYPTGYEQLISFHESTGAIQSKLKIDSLKDAFGRAYYFYEESGNLSSDYNYVNGVKSGSAVSYHDSTDMVKAVMLYNEKGELYYRKTFDEYGNLLKVEGSKD